VKICDEGVDDDGDDDDDLSDCYLSFSNGASEVINIKGPVKYHSKSNLIVVVGYYTFIHGYG